MFNKNEQGEIVNKIVKEQEIVYLAVDSLKKRSPEIQVHIDKKHIDVTFDNKKNTFEIFFKKDLSGKNLLHSLVKNFSHGGEREKKKKVTGEVFYRVLSED